jgi:hypothetical protein
MEAAGGTKGDSNLASHLATHPYATHAYWRQRDDIRPGPQRRRSTNMPPSDQFIEFISYNKNSSTNGTLGLIPIITSFLGCSPGTTMPLPGMSNCLDVRKNVNGYFVSRTSPFLPLYTQLEHPYAYMLGANFIIAPSKDQGHFIAMHNSRQTA